MKKIALTAAAVSIAAACWAAPVLAKPQGAMSGPEIQKYFSGTRIYGTTPSGKTWFVDYNKGGTFLGVVEKGQDAGKWWVKGDTLCRKWGVWEKNNYGHAHHEKSERCFHIVHRPAQNRIDFYKQGGALYRSWRTK